MARSRAKRKLDAAFDTAVDDSDSDVFDAEEEDEELYVVERIIEEKDGRFLVSWAGYDDDENTWEPEGNLKAETVKAFRQQQAKLTSKQKSTGRKKKAAAATDGTSQTTAETSQSGNATSPTTIEPSEQEERAADTVTAGRRTASGDPLIGQHVSFAPQKENWIPISQYKSVGSAYLVGVISRVKIVKPKSKTPITTYEVRWTTTAFQSKTKNVHYISREKVLEGIEAHAKVTGAQLRDESWEILCRPYQEAYEGDDLWDEYEEIDESQARFDRDDPTPEDAHEVELIEALDFQPQAVLEAPPDLFTHEDGTSDARHTNAYGAHLKRPDVSLDEMMKFLGILFYMSVVDKREYSNYWGTQVEDDIFDTVGIGLEKVMTLKRFQHIRRSLSFRYDATADDLRRDPAARIRPLLNLLKIRSTKFVIPGRDCAVDESSIACRSRYTRHLIVYNSSKPTGKYHFKIYMACCSSSWLMISFRLHCASGIGERLAGVVNPREAEALERALATSAEVRKHVVEVTKPIHGSKRIINTDNFYTSVQLLETLRVFGLYGRGTIRENSKHYPRCVMLSKNDKAPRGSMKQAVSTKSKIVGASWVDAAVVNIVSNADDSSTTQVFRRVGKERVAFPAPKCVTNYNSGMQGVDRIDQLRGRFSIADGHTFRKWHKKLAMAFIDLARCNAFVSHKLAGGKPACRDPHREFVIELIQDLLGGGWQHSLTDAGTLNADPTEPDLAVLRRPSRENVPQQTPERRTNFCAMVDSVQQFPTARFKRGCVVCRLEGRSPTEITTFCLQHHVSLCSKTYAPDPTKHHLCQEERWTCWEKYHQHYYPSGVFNDKGHIRRSSAVHKSNRHSTPPLPFSPESTTSSVYV